MSNYRCITTEDLIKKNKAGGYMNSLKINDKVIFTGCSEAQQLWGNYSNHNMLKKDSIYTIDDVEIHSWHTKVSLKEVDGWFNSVCFKKQEDL